MLSKKVFRTSDIVRFGLENYDIRATRNARIYAEKPLKLIRRLSKFEKECRNISCKEGVYIIDEKAIKDYLQPSLF